MLPTLKIRVPKNNTPVNNNFSTSKQVEEKEAARLKEEARIEAERLKEEKRHNAYIAAKQKEQKEAKILEDYKYSSYLISILADNLTSKTTKYTEDEINRFKSELVKQRNKLDNFVIIHPEYKARYDKLITQVDKNFKDKLYNNNMTQRFNKIRNFEQKRPKRKTRKTRKNRK
jgi:hypothetical protein